MRLARREFLSMLAAGAWGGARAAVLLEVRSGRTIAVHAPEIVNRSFMPPGSTIKPFVLEALLRMGKLTRTEPFWCPGRLTIAGRPFNCSHPRLDFPLR